MPALNTRYAKSDTFLARLVGDVIVLVPAGRIADEVDSLYPLNRVGARVWRLIDGETSVQEIASHIAEEFGVSTEAAQHDVLAFLDELRGIGAVRTAAQA